MDSSGTQNSVGARGWARSRALVGLAVLALCGGTGCIGAVVGTIIDTTRSAIEYPIHEYVFRGAYKFANDPDAPWRELEDDRGRDYGNELVGVAVSGGGSRSAYFLACVLDKLRRVPVAGAPGEPSRSLLDEIDYISSVSGGALSAAYYVLRRPPGSDEAGLDAFFARYRAEMRKDFEIRSLARLALLFRWVPAVLTHYDRGHVMASTWDANFFDGTTFADLPEPKPPYPSLIINATSYSSGNKFLLTRLASSHFNEGEAFRTLRRRGLITEGYDPAHRPLSNEGFDTIDSDIGRFRLSLAVVASAGVPNLLGPIALKDRTRKDAYVALGDGGIYDNYGLETLVQLFTHILEERPGMRARIIIVDAAGYFPAEKDVPDYSVAGYADRTTSIAWLRTDAYAEPVFRFLPTLESSGAAADTGDAPGRHAVEAPDAGLRFQVLSLYHRGGGYPARRRRPMQQAVGVVFDPVIGFLDELNESTRAIGTRFYLSRDDANAIAVQAKLVVRDVLSSAD
jgi:predicted acylesterase/phospholipase RssA